MAKLFVLSAPSGAGKSTLIKNAMTVFPDLVFSVSATTRAPRGGEQEGREYFFKSDEAFQQMIRNDELAEYQHVHGHYYGTPKQFIMNMLHQDRNVIIDIDVYGKTKFDNAFPEAVGIFVDVPSFEDLKRRLIRRRTDRPEVIDERIRNAIDEINYARAQGKYKYRIVNDDLKRATQALIEIIKKETASEPDTDALNNA
jgi:guanylate kinase